MADEEDKGFEDASVDMNRLDEEWAKQATLYHKWARRYANARLAYDTAEDRLEVAKAEADRDIRAMPSNFGLTKITEERVKNTVVIHPDYQRAAEALRKARHTMNAVKAKVDSLDHKKYTLQDLVKLRLADYFAEPQPPEGAKEKMNDAKKKAVRNRRNE
jgi:hypothetical protein